MHLEPAVRSHLVVEVGLHVLIVAVSVKTGNKATAKTAIRD